MSELSNGRNALEELRRDLQQKAARYEQTPDLSHLQALLNVCDAISAYEEQVGSRSEALAVCQQTIALMEGFRSREAVGSDFVRDLAQRYLRLAEMHAASDQVMETIHTVQEGLSLWRNLPPEDLSEPEISRQLISAHHRGVELLEELHTRHPAHDALVEALNDTYLHLGTHYEQIGENEKALHLYERAAASLESLPTGQSDGFNPLRIRTYHRLAEYHFYRELPTPALHWLHKEATPLLHQIEHVGADSSLLLALGNNFWNRAHLHFRLGEAERAFDCYRTAIAYLSRYEPRHRELTAPLIQLYMHLGLSHSHGAEYESAVQAYQSGIALAEKLYDESPEEPLAYLLAELYMGAGLAYRNLADYERAETFYLRAIHLQEQLIEHNPDLAGQAASTCDLLAKMYRDLGDGEKAAAYYERAISLYRKLYDMQPDEVFTGITLAFAYQEMADMYEASGRVEQTLQAHRQAISLLRSLMAMHPESHILPERFVDSFFRIIGIYRRLGEYDATREALEQALDAFQTLALQHEPHEEILSAIQRAYEMLADLLNEKDGHAGMQTAYERAVRFWEELSRAAPDNTLVLDTLADTCTILGRCCGDNPEPYEKALNVWRHLEARPDGQGMHYPEKVAGLCVLLAELYERLGDEEKSRRAYEEATATAERVYRMEDGRIAGLQWMIRGYGAWAESLQRRGDTDRALQAYQRIMSLWKAHREDGLLEGVFLQTALESHLKAAALHNALSRHEEALACLAEPTAFIEALQTQHPDESALRDRLSEIYALYAGIYEQLGQRDKAERFRKKQIQLQTNI